MVLETRSEAACFPVSNGEIPGARAKYTWRSIQKWLIVNNLAAWCSESFETKGKKRGQGGREEIKFSSGHVRFLTFPLKRT